MKALKELHEGVVGISIAATWKASSTISLTGKPEVDVGAIIACSALAC